MDYIHINIYNSGLTVNGTFDNACLNAIKNSNAYVSTSQNNKSDLAYFVQGLLNAANISCAVDGQFGNGSKTSLCSFQTANGLTADGCCGPNTWYALFNNGSQPDGYCGPDTWYALFNNGAKYNKPEEKPQTPSSTKEANIKAFQNWLNNSYNAGLSTDGQYGNATKKAAIKAWQTQMNTQFNAGLAVDGGFGTACSNAVSKNSSAILSKSKNSSGTLVKILQGMLNCRGYVCGIDGGFGSETDTQLKAFQKAKGLTADGMCGPATWDAIFNK